MTRRPPIRPQSAEPELHSPCDAPWPPEFTLELILNEHHLESDPTTDLAWLTITVTKVNHGCVMPSLAAQVRCLYVPSQSPPPNPGRSPQRPSFEWPWAFLGHPASAPIFPARPASMALLTERASHRCSSRSAFRAQWPARQRGDHSPHPRAARPCGRARSRVRLQRRSVAAQPVPSASTSRGQD